MARGPVFSGLKLKAKLWQQSEDEQILVLEQTPCHLMGVGAGVHLEQQVFKCRHP